MACIGWSSGKTSGIGLIAALAAIGGCGPTSGDSAMEGDESAALDTSSAGDDASSGEGDDVGSDEPTVAVDVIDALLLSSQGASDRTSVVVHVEVSNLGVAPITAVQLRAFTFAGYATASSILVDPANLADALPLAPGAFAELRFSFEEEGALFDCAAWDGPRVADTRLSFTIDGESVDAGVDGNVRCRDLE